MKYIVGVGVLCLFSAGYAAGALHRAITQPDYSRAVMAGSLISVTLLAVITFAVILFWKIAPPKS